MTETELKKRVLRMIKKEFPKVWCYKSNDRFISGLPDLILSVPNLEMRSSFCAIELKRPGAKPRPLQVRVLENIRASGGQAICADSVEQCRHFLADCQLL